MDRPPPPAVRPQGRALQADRKGAPQELTSRLRSSSSRQRSISVPGDRRRVVIDRVRPQIDCGRLPAKATVGISLEVSARLIADGHDPLLAWVWHGPPATAPTAPRLPRGWRSVPARVLADDRYLADLSLDQTGAWCFVLVGVPDAYGDWVRGLRIRMDAGQDVTGELEEGALLAERSAAVGASAAADKQALTALATRLRARGPVAGKVRAAERASARALMRRAADLGGASLEGPFPLWVERDRAGFSAWYEMFPRSEGADPPRSGTLRTALRRLPAIAAMGFDVVYLPPIHPIGITHRKGSNNALESNPEDPGSPWAIGSKDGGHDAVHPELGTLTDFDAFVKAAKRAGMEVALDYALQCSPDHPWVQAHPEWFLHRADGSIRYAENPPKKYQDIYPLNFDNSDAAGLWSALRDLMLFWVSHGVRIFRVDNPHTKPFRFWQWLIDEVRRRHPDVILLAEAFTRPSVMQRLGMIGFSQSYTYFTWRNSKRELSEYLHELSQTEMVDWFRPNFWVNTPDILHATLQYGGAAAFRLRAALAAVTCPSWGMYSGYELAERTPLREGSEEYLNSEKYELRPRRWDNPDSLAPFITLLNQVRHRHRDAIALLRTLSVQHIDNEHMLCVSRSSASRDDVLLLVVNLDPHAAHEATTWLDLDAMGIAADRPFVAHDELSGATYTWQGPVNYVRLDPGIQPAHILHLRQG
jgi:starch synthase (maltosyl-transferring)